MRLSGLAAAVVLVSCQTYDFERVVPLTVAQTTTDIVVASKRLKPNVMLLVDKSGSMKEAIDDMAPGCTLNCGKSGFPDCLAGCPTRISELQSAMSTFLQSSGTVARLGATTYPIDEGCTAPANIDVALPPPTTSDEGAEAELADSATRIGMLINGPRPVGGTPTAASLAFIGTYNELNRNAASGQDDYRDDYVLLLTDGLPNCNGANPNGICGCGNSCSVAQTTACACTSASASCVGLNCTRGCLDSDGAVERVKALRQKGIRTIVVGFGADLASGSGPQVLNAMAREGGVARECATEGTDRECGGTQGSCNVTTKQCSTAFYQAANGTELATTLRKILEVIVPGDPCEFTLVARPSDARYLTVMIDGVFTAEGSATYSYDFNANRVTFLGPLCERLKASTPQHPVAVQFRIVERF
ncbi:MAG: adventurous gliding motility lipoprotein CglB [Archangium sp.]|nr:adventurous gliding motility lipoprotein CglB [Archangium sp.]